MSFLLKNTDSGVTESVESFSRAIKRCNFDKKAISCGELISLFNYEFFDTHNTRLMGYAEEPEYRPADGECPYNRIIFTQDYIASALHEVAHWCVAGEVRRQQIDYGYWYEPDGRSPQQQRLFEQVEVKPQALEWIFSRACGLNFRISADNINAPPESRQPSLLFKQGIVKQAQQYCVKGLNNRAKRWVSLLQEHYNNPSSLDAGLYTLASLK